VVDEVRTGPHVKQLRDSVVEHTSDSYLSETKKTTKKLKNNKKKKAANWKLETGNITKKV
jgi:hypothetical protein